MDEPTSMVFIPGTCFTVKEAANSIFGRMSFLPDFEFITVELVDGGTAYLKVSSIIGVAEDYDG